MLKQSIIYLALSILTILFAKYMHVLIVYIDYAFVFVNLQLSQIFSHNPTGDTVRRVLTLVFIPMVITAIPALIYRLIKKRQMPYFIECTWIVWLIIVLSSILVQ